METSRGTATGGGGPQSLLVPTVRRSLRSGRTMLAVGTAWGLIIGVLLAATSAATYLTTFPIVLPIFASLGATSALTIFTSDRMKGVLEYLMAYGVSPRRLLSNYLAAALAAVLLISGVALVASLAVFLAKGQQLTADFAVLLGGYALPMGFVSAAFSSILGMYWSALSSPREGMNSPTGLAPFLSMVGPVATLIGTALLAATVGLTPEGFLLLAGTALALLTATVVYLLGNIGRLLHRERFLSTS